MTTQKHFSWNSFQSKIKGHGYSPTEISFLYQEHKKGHIIKKDLNTPEQLGPRFIEGYTKTERKSPRKSPQKVKKVPISSSTPSLVMSAKFPKEIVLLSMLNMDVRDVLNFCSTNKLIAKELCNDAFWKQYAQKYGLAKEPNKTYKDLFIEGVYELWAIGNNNNSQFGKGKKKINAKLIQIQIPGNLKVRYVDSMDNMTVAIDENFDAWIFGNTTDSPEEFGLGGRVKSNQTVSPIRLNPGGIKIKRVFLVQAHSEAIRSFGGGILVDTKGGVWLFGYGPLRKFTYTKPTKVKGTGENGIIAAKAYGLHNGTLLVLDKYGVAWVLGYMKDRIYYFWYASGTRIMEPKRLVGKKTFKDVHMDRRGTYYLYDGKNKYEINNDGAYIITTNEIKGYDKLSSNIYLDSSGIVHFSSDYLEPVAIGRTVYLSSGWNKSVEVRCGILNGIIIDRGSIYGLGKNLNGQLGLPLVDLVRTPRLIPLPDGKKCHDASVGRGNIFVLLK